MKTPEEFKKQSEIKNITFWGIHNCSMCNYLCGFVFQDGLVYYDSGCDCTRRSSIEQST